MVHSGLLVCSFFIKDRYGRDNSKAIELNNSITINGIETTEYYENVWEILRSFLTNHSMPKDDENSMKLFSVNPKSIHEEDDKEYHAITFVVNSGSYGIEGNITNRNTKSVMYHRTRDDADVKQFHATLFIPKDAGGVKVQKGILLFQTIGTYGIKTITTKQMKEFFASKDLTFETRSVSVAIFLKKIFEDGNLNKITLIKNAISPDPADSMLISSGREEKVYIKPRLKESWIKKLIAFIDGNKDDTIFEINESVYEDISITFNLSGRTRTVRLKDLDRFSLTEDIPDSIYNNGLTNPDKLTRFMINKAIEYKEKMIFRVSE
ncbi:MAG: hypothetical protein IKH75_18515 [Ruminococcus sp.]|uniref:hypothetical protein n=1 Tax=Ruminococcus flavefaciens TaxID=1265 RepID=UPI0026E9A997|nr:hypothetical protein [Ruminococcus flavefaciens]MBR6985482.1 hypothetical protein [Ruminococcus sp.]